MTATLGALRRGEGGRINSIHRHGPVTRRLLAMGLVPGVFVRVVQTAPLGDPITVQFESNRVSIRRADASVLGVDLSAATAE